MTAGPGCLPPCFGTRVHARASRDAEASSKVTTEARRVNGLLTLLMPSADLTKNITHTQKKLGSFTNETGDLRRNPERVYFSAKQFGEPKPAQKYPIWVVMCI